MPSPTDTELRVHASPVPTQIVFGFDGSRVTEPIDCTACLSNIGLNVVPPSSDFHTPPDAAPMNTTVLPPSLYAATAAMRPLIVAEPMLRALMPATVLLSNTAGPGFTVGAVPGGGLSPGPGSTILSTFWPGCGILNHASSEATFVSTRSTVSLKLCGPPTAPLSIENGIHTPLTCW